jgi:hypothetical protein
LEESAGFRPVAPSQQPQVTVLARVLAKKKDPVTHTCFIDFITKVCHWRKPSGLPYCSYRSLAGFRTAVSWVASAPLSTLVHFDNPTSDKCSQKRPMIASRIIGCQSEARKYPFFASALLCGF